MEREGLETGSVTLSEWLMLADPLPYSTKSSSVSESFTSVAWGKVLWRRRAE